MTKAKIVQRLLDKGQITAEEAVVLLQNETVSIPMYNPNPYFHDPNFAPGYTPPNVYCSDSTGDTKGDWEYSDTKYTDPNKN